MTAVCWRERESEGGREERERERGMEGGALALVELSGAMLSSVPYALLYTLLSYLYIDTRAHTHTHTQTRARAHTHTHTYICAYTWAHVGACTQTHTLTCFCAH